MITIGERPRAKPVKLSTGRRRRMDIVGKRNTAWAKLRGISGMLHTIPARVTLTGLEHIRGMLMMNWIDTRLSCDMRSRQMRKLLNI